MADYISEFNKAQVEFVEKKDYVSEILGNISEELQILLGGEGFIALITAQIRRNANLSMQGYAHWLATKLVRSGDFEKDKVELPICDEKSLVLISEKFDVPIDFVRAFVRRIVWVGTGPFPLLGCISAGDINILPAGRGGGFVPDKEALQKYKDSFDFTK